MKHTLLPKRENVSFSQVQTRSLPFLKGLFTRSPTVERIIYRLDIPVDTVNFDYWRFRDKDRPEFGWIVKVPKNPAGRVQWRTQMLTWYCDSPEEALKHFRDIGELIEMTHDKATVVTEINADVEDRIYLNSWVGYDKNFTLVPYGLHKANKHLIKKREKQQ
jgi:hypothetical protein